MNNNFKNKLIIKKTSLYEVRKIADDQENDFGENEENVQTSLSTVDFHNKNIYDITSELNSYRENYKDNTCPDDVQDSVIIS